MKTLRKTLSVIISVCLVLSLCSFFGTAADTKKTYLLLGDSITAGFGVKNPDEACYGKIVADTNGYEYINDAVTARDSEILLNRVQNSYSMRYDILKADIISISIGSNDYFANDDVANLVIGALLGVNNKTLNEIAENYYLNLCGIIDEIRELNPHAVILLQNVYIAWNGVTSKVFEAGAGRVNKMIDRYLAQTEYDNIYLCDIAPAITGHGDCIASDCVHPNAKGNVEISKIVLKQLYDLGLGTQTEPVLNTPGIDYNFFVEQFGAFAGTLITSIVKTLTGNL